MKTRITLILVLTMAFLLLSSCGLSPEEIATQTASAWTSTPVPPTSTPTPTPIPYDVNISIIDVDGNPISEASIVFPESGDDQPVIVDPEGSYAWFNLSGSEGNVQVSSQGYYLSETSLSLERGANDVVVQLERDPFQILPSEACLPGQEVLLIEDFEDQQLQGWQGYSRPLWNFEEDDARGTYLIASPGGDEYTIDYAAQEFGNMVWHIDTRRNNTVAIMWLGFHASPGQQGYIDVIFGNGQFSLQKQTGPGNPQDLAQRSIGFPSQDDPWERISISVYDGILDFWVNDELMAGATDNNDPHEKGSLWISVTPPENAVAFDNIVICGLSEPYIPPPVEPAE